MSLGLPVASLECGGAAVTRREFRVAPALAARVLLTKLLDSLPCVVFFSFCREQFSLAVSTKGSWKYAAWRL